jgi:hypothetical protein
VGGDRGLQQARELQHLLAGVQRTGADCDHGMFRGTDDRHGALDAVGVDRRRHGPRQRALQDQLDALAEHVPRCRQRSRTRPTAMHGVERVRYRRAGLGGMVNAGGPFDDRSKGR